jgi:hypothetical protein
LFDSRSVAGAVDLQVQQLHDIRRGGGDDDAVGQRGEDSGVRGRAVDGDRLGNRHGTVASRIKDGDLAAGRGLRDRSRERLARRRPAAGIGVVSHARHPGSSRLRECHRAAQQQTHRDSQSGPSGTDHFLFS